MIEKLKLKRYIHFSEYYEGEDSLSLKKYISNPKKVSSHKFFPFIERPIKKRRFRKAKNCNFRIGSTKPRKIKYCNHLDSLIYAHYATKLSKKYEDILAQDLQLNSSIIAYRAIPIRKGTEKPCKNTIHHVADLIKEIEQKKFTNYYAIALDISNFFEDLKHKKIKESWKTVMGYEKKVGDDIIPKDQYKVFKNITKYSWVEYHDAFKNSSHNHKSKSPRILRNKADLKKKEPIKSFFTDGEDFRKNIVQKKLINKNKKDCGIPQGSPISPILANMYMLQFDKKVINFLNENYPKSIYRRYSDDILLIIDNCDLKEVLSNIDIFKDDLDLKIQPTKTQIYSFKKIGTSYQCSKINENKESILSNSSLEYLGFSYDGNRVLLKNASLSNYYMKMKRFVRRQHVFVNKKSTDVHKEKLFINKGYKAFTHIGSKRGYKYVRKEKTTDKWYRPKRKSNKVWGNYYSYAKQAIEIFNQNSIKNGIKGQMSRHSQILHSEYKNSQIKNCRDRVFIKCNHEQPNSNVKCKIKRIPYTFCSCHEKAFYKKCDIITNGENIYCSIMSLAYYYKKR
ncbi:reverse transcriptase domain-containing protein [Flammeovirga sp. OC4]|uniref:reverse transcriptase domain-containing protein n=1 Tax=Flammeovirga sp. OC4 TaxID=1382345 RepID=UPI0005C76029|nr:reverse transcriptase domain-containing protein [Flammeovirga sp. OC4]